jgi:hypothetical protein
MSQGVQKTAISSSVALRRCSPSIMGLWATATHRKFRTSDFRFEVSFETPAIFLAHPKNRCGPILGREIHYIDGTEKSYKDTKVLGNDVQMEALNKAMTSERTVGEREASWVTLLSTLLRVEKESRKWDENMQNMLPPPSEICSEPRAPAEPEYQLAVGIQRTTRSWDFMPAAIMTPYATSAICYLVEVVAMLGMYWKVFDQTCQTLWYLRAEGNGFFLTSTNVQGLGVMVVFTANGTLPSQSNRVIPSEMVKEFAFGTVPNIFDNSIYLERDASAQSLDLVFGSENDVNTTLESLGCTSQTLEQYKNNHNHIFSGR